MTPILTDTQIHEFANLIARKIDDCEVNSETYVNYADIEALVRYTADVEEFEDGGWRPYNEKVEVIDFMLGDFFGESYSEEFLLSLQDKLNFMLN